MVVPHRVEHRYAASGERGRGAEYVRRPVGIARELSSSRGSSAHVRRDAGAQRVLADDCVNLEQGGLRGSTADDRRRALHLRATQIDVDEQTGVEQLARHRWPRRLKTTAWRDNEWYVARCVRPRCVLRSGAPSRIISRAACACRSVPPAICNDRAAAFHRVPPGPGQIEVAVRALSVNFAVMYLSSRGRYPSFEGHPPSWAMDFAGVVTAVDQASLTTRLVTMLVGMSPNGCWGTFVV